ncbi:divalent-cation tolerance protein CutA [Klebsiella michiganensis]|uniref:Divalent-cation tolerance protein CutA n=1 Tax=Klebsiella michiganensis TaxID=1134687 RepID=A0A7H4M1S2_9ENTR|nr:divalent-cation tolerance protein CutA [Klebsiella michiganensis]
MTMPDAVVVLCTAPDEATAQDLAAKALAENSPPAPLSCRERHRSTTGKENWSRSMKCKCC